MFSPPPCLDETWLCADNTLKLRWLTFFSLPLAPNMLFLQCTKAEKPQSHLDSTSSLTSLFLPLLPPPSLLPLQELPNPVDFITEIPLTLFPLSPFSLPQLKPLSYLSLELHILTSYLASRHPTSGPSYILLPVHFPLSTYCIPGRGWRGVRYWEQR